jgi:glycosyltransferase involved in cell wall biosynthesis
VRQELAVDKEDGVCSLRIIGLRVAADRVHCGERPESVEVGLGPACSLAFNGHRVEPYPHPRQSPVIRATRQLEAYELGGVREVTTVCWVKLGSAAPMGQQAYETHLRGALDSGGQGWSVQERKVVPFRARDPDGVHVPLRLVWAAPFLVARSFGRMRYGDADLVHRLDLRCPPSGRREVLTIHDLPPLRFDDEGGLPSWAARSAREASAVICPSRFAADEVGELLGVEDVYVIPYGIAGHDGDGTMPLTERELEAIGLRAPFVLHAAGATKRKNLDGLADAWLQVRAACPDAMLALCGPPHPRRDALFADLDGVRYLGHREAHFIVRLMRAAAVVVVPSLYEGFGLPALEAMATGTPTVAAARGALPEICRDGALLVEPSAAGIAGGILAGIAGGEHVERRCQRGLEIARQYTWERAAAATASVYESVLGR